MGILPAFAEIKSLLETKKLIYPQVELPLECRFYCNKGNGDKMKTAVIVLAIIFALAMIGETTAIAESKVKAIVVFTDRPTSDDTGFFEKQGGVIRYKYNIIPGIALDIPPRISEMCSDPTNPANPPICSRIAYLELDREVHATGKPAPLQPPQTLPWGIDRVDAELSWIYSTGNGVKVAVIDTGIDYTHPDLDANVLGGVNFVSGRKDFKDDNGHGTHVAGTIAAENNGIGVVGVAPNVQLYGVKVLDRTGSGWISDVIAGIDWSAANGMNVVTMSLTGPDVQALHDAVDNAYNQGIVLVAAAGNNNGAIGYPAKYGTVIAVTATDQNNYKASFSNYGPEAELAAPGVSIYSTYKGGTYATLSGTSMATPHVTGTVALLLATQIPAVYDINSNGLWDPAEVRNRLKDTATDLGASGWDSYYGHGLINAYMALQQIP